MDTVALRVYLEFTKLQSGPIPHPSKWPTRTLCGLNSLSLPPLLIPSSACSRVLLGHAEQLEWLQ
eukprot:2221260-Pleurochrysis_carterae.AAC.1